MATEWKEPMKWENAGIEPSDSLKQTGFKAGDKPPAAVFNYFLNKTGECIEELQTAVDGKADSDHTHTLDDVSETTNKKIMTAAERTKLDGIDDGANAYTHPAYTAKSSGLYKVTVDATGHVSAATKVTKDDITALGIPASDTDTTYSNATTSSDGLMSASDKAKLNGIATGANKTTVDSALSDSSTNPVQNKVVKSALDGKSNTGHTHTLAEVSDTTNKKAAYLATASSTDGVAYTATVDGITELYTGLTITIIPNLQSTSRTPTLNVNGLGAKRMVMPINGSNTSSTTQPPVVYNDDTTEEDINSKIAVAAKWLTANKPVTVRYDGTYWETDLVAQSASCLYGTVPIESGGTGANNAAEARANLGLTDAYINSLIDAKLGVIENGSY